MGVSYTGVVLDSDSQQSVFRLFDGMRAENLTPVGFVDRNAAGQLLAHHMTMNMGPCKQRSLLGMEVILTADAWAIDEKVMAVRISDHQGVYCDNETPHVTVLVNPGRRGSPRHSNGLTNWVKLPEPLVLSGTVREV